MSQYQNLGNSPHVLESYQEIKKNLIVPPDLSFNQNESYQLGVLLASDNHKKKYGYKDENFIKMLDSIFSKVNYELFIEAINDVINENYQEGNYNEFAGKILCAKDGTKYFYWLDFNKLIMSYQDIFQKAPYLNLIKILKEKNLYDHFLPESRKLEGFSNLYSDFLYYGIKNSDDRVFNWVIDFAVSFNQDFKINSEIFKEKFIPQLIKVFTNYNINQEKYLLKRIKKLRELTDLKKYYSDLVSNCRNYKLSWRFFKIITDNYYDKNDFLEFNQCFIYNFIFEVDYLEKLKYLKKTFTKNHFNSLIFHFLVRVQDLYYLNPEAKYLFPVFQEIIENHYYGDLGILIQGLTYLLHQYFRTSINKPYDTYLLYYDQIIKILKLSFKKQPIHREFLSEHLRLNFDSRFIRILAIIFGKIYSSRDENLLKMNYLSSQIRMYLSRKYLEFNKPIQDNFKNLINQLITFEPNPKIKVLNQGCYHSQIINSSFLKSPHPIIRVPKEFNFNYLVRGYYLEKYQLYLISDIYLENTSLPERLEFIRKLHPLTKNSYSLPFLHNLDYKINKINEEELYLNLKNNKIKWYPHLHYYLLDETTKTTKLISSDIN